MLYVITDGEHFKFGTSISANGRLRTLQAGNPRKLSIVATISDEWTVKAFGGDTHAEAHLHALLAEYRVIGEWFKDVPFVRAIIEMIRGEHFGEIIVLSWVDLERTLKVSIPVPYLGPSRWSEYFSKKRANGQAQN